jgi:single-strand DNA-binding protein
VRTTTNGNSVATLRVATNERFQKKDGNWEDRTEWHNIVVWGKDADRCKSYLKKGSQVFVEGKLQTRSWEDREGKKRYTTEIVAGGITFIGISTGERAPAAESTEPGEQPPAPKASKQEAPATSDEDFPF